MHWNAALQCAGLWVIFSLVAGRLTEEQKLTIMNMHNELRSQVHPSAAFMQRVVWDEKLRLEAEAYASKCIWNHNPRLKQLSMGDNLFSSTEPFNATKAMLDWFGEHVDYNYENNACPEEMTCRHYTQMVWAKSNKLGCATYLCNTITGLSSENRTLLVCNYFPRGNVVGQRPYESGEACSKCPDNLPVCEEKICVAENLFSSEEPVSEDTEHSTVSPEDPLTIKEHTTAPVEPTKVRKRMDESSVEREMSGSEIQKASAPLLLAVWLLAALI
ncbi:peptidase inhibitor 16-like [Xyrauchen texanus]|uniref:peptidase inhibitor 16-like n=1 Tax=Xyrauchen texanus TaxID=154827 RepID=UPI002242A1EC|nr:peptidase inhibitor 16-like [Xyrauchen texanus]